MIDSPIYLVITADMIQSGKFSLSIKQSLLKRLHVIDKKLDTLIPSALYAGDEIQMIWSFQRDKPCWPMLFDLYRFMHPMLFRLGIGIGPVDQPLVHNIAQNSGQAFIFARDALRFAGKKNLLFWTQTALEDYNCLQSQAFLFSGMTRKWSEKHWRRLFKYYEKRNIYKVAEDEQVSAEAINKFINTAAIRDIIASVDCSAKQADFDSTIKD